MKYEAEAGTVKGKNGRVTWEMSAEEADEIADFIDESTTAQDAARRDSEALRLAAEYARGEVR